MNLVTAFLAFLAGIFCLYVPTTEWVHRRYEKEYEGELAEEKHERFVRTFRYIGYAWFVMGILQLLTM